MTLLDLNDRICKWPIGHPDEPDFHFCGKPVNPGFPYCGEHCLVAYQAQMPRRDRRIRVVEELDLDGFEGERIGLTIFNSSPVQVTRTRLQLSQKLCVIGVMKPSRPPVSSIVT